MYVTSQPLCKGEIDMVFFKRSLIIFSCLFFSMTLGAQTLLTGMTPLQNGAVADASQLNDNLSVISGEISDMQTQIELLIDTSSRIIRVPAGTERLTGGVRISNHNGDLAIAESSATESSLITLDGGKLVLDVDCSVDPYALINAYHENTQYPRLVFNIVGECYGDIFWNQDYSKYVQEFSQDISIAGANPDGSYAVIKPRPLTEALPEDINACRGLSTIGGKAGLVASFNGSLFMDFIELRMGPCDRTGILFSRGAGGDLDAMRIIGTDSNQVLAEIRHNANVYIGNIDMEGSGTGTRGLMIWNGAVVYSYGGFNGSAGLSVQASYLALTMFSASRFFNYGGLASFDGGLSIAGNSSFLLLEFGPSSLTVDGNFEIKGNSRMVVNTLNLSSTSSRQNTVSNSFLEVKNSLTSGVAQQFTCNGLASINIPPEAIDAYAPNCMNDFHWNALVSEHLGAAAP